MSMLKVGGLDNRIISQSVQDKGNRPLPDKKDNLNNTKKMTAAQKILAGAAVVAAVTAAGILIYRGKSVKGNSGTSKHLERVNEAANTVKQKVISLLNEEDDKLIRSAERNKRTKISELFRSFRDDFNHVPQFENRINTFADTAVPKIEPDIRALEPDDFQTVMIFLKSKQCEDITPLDAAGMRRIDELIEDAVPLQNETVVYGSLRTQKAWKDYEHFDFVKDLKEGNIIRNDIHVLTSRGYDDWLAQADPFNYSGSENCGYVLRIALPKNTKGFDCRRCFGRDSDLGINALYILPKGAEFKINNIDNESRIIDVQYLLK